MILDIFCILSTESDGNMISQDSRDSNMKPTSSTKTYKTSK